METTNEIAEEYYRKANIRLIWLICFALIPILSALMGSIAFGPLEVIVFSIPVFISKIFLRIYPMITVTISGIQGVLISSIVGSVIFNLLLELLNDNSLTEIGFIFIFPVCIFVLIAYLILSTFYFAQKWSNMKSTNNEVYNLLDEDEVIKYDEYE